jgi:hypothetical protein
MCVEVLFKEIDTRSVSADEWTAVFSEEQCQFLNFWKVVTKNSVEDISFIGQSSHG